MAEPAKKLVKRRISCSRVSFQAEESRREKFSRADKP